MTFEAIEKVAADIRERTQPNTRWPVPTVERPGPSWDDLSPISQRSNAGVKPSTSRG